MISEGGLNIRAYLALSVEHGPLPALFWESGLCRRAMDAARISKVAIVPEGDIEELHFYMDGSGSIQL